MTFETFPQILLNCADGNGQIRYSTAYQTAKDHGLSMEFIALYGSAIRWVESQIDAGEFLVWMGY